MLGDLARHAGRIAEKRDAFRLDVRWDGRGQAAGHHRGAGLVAVGA
jgi:hypothetical protein